MVEMKVKYVLIYVTQYNIELKNILPVPDDDYVGDHPDWSPLVHHVLHGCIRLYVACEDYMDAVLVGIFDC